MKTRLLLPAAMLLVTLGREVATAQNAEEHFKSGLEKSKSGDFTAALQSFNQAIAMSPDNAPSFYNRGWAKANLRDHRGAILDFDFCPREDIRALEPPFSNRLEALRSLEELREQLTSNPMKSFANFSYLSLKLEGASAFLRALMGERWEFGRYLRATMGIDPVPMPADAIAEVRERLEARLSRLGIPHSEEGRAAFEEALVMREMEGFEQRLQLEATRWVDRIQRRVGLNTTPRYAIESAHEDAYWANWIDGSVDGPIRLRINLHPRISYHRGAETNLAVHEIGGHAMHVLEMDAARRRGEIDAPSLNLTVHSCEAFQMEGLAQSVLQLVGEEEEIPEAVSYTHLTLPTNREV